MQINFSLQTVNFSNCTSLTTIDSDIFDGGGYITTLNLTNCKSLTNENLNTMLNNCSNSLTNLNLAGCNGITAYNIELQDARSKYLSAQQEYINTVFKYGLARANLDFVMGVK